MLSSISDISQQNIPLANQDLVAFEDQDSNTHSRNLLPCQMCRHVIQGDDERVQSLRASRSLSSLLPPRALIQESLGKP